MRRLALVLTFGLLVPPMVWSQEHRVGVVSESGDIVTWLRPVAGGLVVDRVVPVGVRPADMDGPHNLAVAPDQRSYYITIAHGMPFGTLWRYDATNDTVMGRAQVELFPTTIALSPDGDWAFVANSDFHGERPRVNPVTIIYTPTMARVTDLPACDMPHGVRVNHAGTRVYVSCMHSDEILELDGGTFEILRRVPVGSGHAMPGGHQAPPARAETAGAAGVPTADLSRECSPTFVSVSPDDRWLYLPCHSGNLLQIHDAATLAFVGSVPVGEGPYNAEPTPDGRLVLVTNKKGQSVSLVDPIGRREVARIPTTKQIVHGIAYAPDGRTAYISAESIGSDPGSVDVLDLDRRVMTGTIAIPAQPTGIAVLRLPQLR